MYMCVHKIMNMYIHGMYMVQTCMYRFAHSCGGVRIPDVGHVISQPGFGYDITH